MIRPARQFVPSSALIGRASALAQLGERAGQARSGRGQTVLISGQAGIGKSRLVKELETRTSESGFIQLQGYCFETDRSLPYGPLLDQLRNFSSSITPAQLLQYLGSTAVELVKLLPELAAQLPDIVPSPALPPEPEKHRLFRTLAQFMVRLSAIKPLLVVVEDLHCSDDTSLEFLAFLARKISEQPILLILTYRSEEVENRLSYLLGELDRARLATELRLAPLSMVEVDQMLRVIFDLQRPVRTEFLEVLYKLTEGNPFFIEEILKELIESGDIYYTDDGWDRKPIGELRIPRTILDAVHRRIERLDETGRRALWQAAAIGQRFHFELLRELTGMEEHALLRVIKEFVNAQLVVEESADQFAFRHALTREAVYSTLLLRERREYHRAIMEAIERLFAGTLPEHMADLAYHSFEAENWEKALEFSQRAGDQALALFAPREAIAHYSRAEQATRHLARPLAVPLLRGRGRAYETIGEFDSARLDHEQALNMAHQSHNGQDKWQSLVDLGSLWASKDYAKTGDYNRRALELARTLGEPTLLAHSLNRLGNWLVNTGAADEGLRAHQEALAIFQEREDKPGMAETLDLLGTAGLVGGDIPAAVINYGRAIALFRELGDSRGLPSSLMMRTALATINETTYDAQETLAEVERETEEALRLVRQIGWGAGEVSVQFAAGSSLAMFGQFGKGLEHAKEAVRIATEIEHRQWICGANTHLGQIYVLMLLPEEALGSLQAARPLAFELGSSWWIGFNSCYLALAHLLRRDTQQAQAVLEEAASRDRIPRDTPERRVSWAWGELLLAQGDPEAALRTAESLLQSVPGARRDEPIPALLKLKGESLLALKRLREAEEILRMAREGALLRGVLPLLWQIQADLAVTYRQLRRYEDAEREAAAARATVQSLSETLEELLRSEFVNAASLRLPKEKSTSPQKVAKKEFGGLTAREREVAALVAEGRSNPEIARILVLSDRTITTHVSNILSKLGFTSRAQIAAWAGQKGLVYPSDTSPG